MSPGWAIPLTRGHGHGSDTAPPSKGTFAAEARRIPDRDDQLRGRDDADANLMGKRRPAGLHERCHALLKRADARLPLLELGCQFLEPGDHLGGGRRPVLARELCRGYGAQTASNTRAGRRPAEELLRELVEDGLG